MTGGGGDSGGRPGSRWLDGAGPAGAQALRQALDEAAADSAEHADDEQAFAHQRIWNRVQAPWFGTRGGPGGPRRGWLRPFLVGAGVMAAAAAGVLVLGTGVLDDRQPTVATVSPPAAPPEVQPLPARAPAGGALTTGPGERVRHRLVRGVDAELSPRTALVPGDEQAPPEVRVGRVRFSVPHQPPGQRYSVRAGAFEVVVLGTVFDVAVEASGVGVSVSNGTVEVREAGSPRTLARLTPGEQWSSEVEAPATPPAALPAPRASAPLRKPQPHPRRVAAVAGREAERTLDQAGELRRRDPRRALAMYRRMLAAGGPLAEIAQYEIGVIEDEDLRDPRQAVVTWDRYRTRYPGGLLRTEADLSVIEALSRTGERGRALAEAREFLTRHPNSERRSEVARLAGDLTRERGDCAGAIALYDQALSSRPATDDADDASFHRAACLGRAGDARGSAGLREYLKRFPLGRHAGEAQRLLSGAARPVTPAR
jgi:ferric-dicitrate binding protein FerR (iron transport regulator)